MTSIFRAAFLLLVVTTLCTGCSSDNKTELTGIVQLDDKPIEEGRIELFTAERIPLGGGAIKQGSFSLRAKPAENVRVEITASRAVGKIDPVMKAARQEQYIPAKYNDSSVLTMTIKPSDNEPQNFSLQSN